MIYLDNASTTGMTESSVAAVHTIMEKYWGNPSSLHRLGVEAEKVLKQARTIIADSLTVRAEEIIFTSGATESCNLFIRGIARSYKNRGQHMITTETEHPAVLKTMEDLAKEGYEITYLPVDSQGLISTDDLRQALRDDTIIVALMHVNNETGVIQPISDAGKIIKKESRAFFFVDGVQGYLKIPLSIEEAGIDAYAISAHKVHGPKGVGALYLRKNLVIDPLITGGGQERGLRSGTENTAGLAGFARAVQTLSQAQPKERSLLQKQREDFMARLKTEVPEIRVNGAQDLSSSPYIINLSLPKVQGETLLHGLEADQIYVSTGSACSGKSKVSRVLGAMKIPEQYLHGAIRISIGLLEWPDARQQQAVAESLKHIYARIR